MQLCKLTTVVFVALAFILEAAPRRIKKFPGGRVINGHDTTIERHPHQVSIRTNHKTRGYHFCGGSIISDKWVLSAAHCVQGDNASSDIVRVGTTNNLYGTDHELSAILIHPKYKFNGVMTYDFALLQVKRRFQFGPCVQPIQLVRSTPPVSSSVIATGWGYRGANVKDTNILQEVELFIVNWDDCKRWYNGRPTLQEVCAAAPNWDKATCSGDSGGPLVYQGKLVGVTSWGVTACVAFEHPTVFADVTSAFEWIYITTGVY